GFQPNFPIKGLHDALSHQESHPKSLRALGLLNPLFEEHGSDAVWHSSPLVFNPYLHKVTAQHGPYGQTLLTGILHSLSRIVDEYVQRLLQPLWANADGGVLLQCQFELDLEVLVASILHQLTDAFSKKGIHQHRSSALF